MTDVVDFRKLQVSTTFSYIYISNSEGALGEGEQKSSPTDVLDVRHVLKQSTSNLFMFEVSVKLSNLL